MGGGRGEKRGEEGKGGTMHPHLRSMAVESICSTGPVLMPIHQNHIGVGAYLDLHSPCISPRAFCNEEEGREASRLIQISIL